MLYSNGEFIYLLDKQCQILRQYAENSLKIVIIKCIYIGTKGSGTKGRVLNQFPPSFKENQFVVTLISMLNATLTHLTKRKLLLRDVKL